MPAKPPVAPGELPALPEGAEVTAWTATLPPGMTSLSPRVAMLLMLHSSYLRWLEVAAYLEKQVKSAGGSRAMVEGAGGLVGHRVGMSQAGPYPTGEEIRALTKLEGEERDRVMRYARECHEVGLLGDDW